jgi:uncharacterized protein YjbI with pentapeptide repeats
MKVPAETESPAPPKTRENARSRAEFATDPEWLTRLREDETRSELPDLSGQRLVKLDLSGLDLRGLKAAGADFSRCDLSGSNLFGAQLEGAIFFGARLEKTELSGADLRGANLEGARAPQAGFGQAQLQGGRLSGGDFSAASFTGANLDEVVGIGAKMAGARLRETSLRRAECPQVDLRGADLSGACVEEASFPNADLRESSVGGINGYESASWLGADVRDVDCSHAYGFRRFVADQNFLDEVERRNPWLYRVWLWSCDCGRSLGRWAAWTGLFTIVFAGAYEFVDVDYGRDKTWFSPIYYSVVTMTTLGYGDVTPNSVPAQFLAVTQAILGYVMLGGMLSILSAKLARRAE